MTIDKARLEALAERLIAATDRLHEDEKSDELGDAWSLADDAYVEASGPGVLLTLLAENEQLQGARQQADELLSAANFHIGPWGDELARKVILQDVSGLRPAMVEARTKLEQATSDIWELEDERDQIKADLEIAHIACQISIAENIGLKGEVKALQKKAGRARAVAIPAKADPKYWESFPELEGGPDFNGCRYVSDLLAALKADGITVSEVLP